jgi:hypothetical protein
MWEELISYLESWSGQPRYMEAKFMVSYGIISDVGLDFSLTSFLRVCVLLPKARLFKVIVTSMFTVKSRI